MSYWYVAAGEEVASNNITVNDVNQDIKELIQKVQHFFLLKLIITIQLTLVKTQQDLDIIMSMESTMDALQNAGKLVLFSFVLKFILIARCQTV